MQKKLDAINMDLDAKQEDPELNKTYRELKEQLVTRQNSSALFEFAYESMIGGSFERLGDLILVEQFIAEHTFFEVDWRRQWPPKSNEPSYTDYYDTNVIKKFNISDERAYHMLAFPKPPIEHEHAGVVQHCKHGLASDCIHYVAQFALFVPCLLLFVCLSLSNLFDSFLTLFAIEQQQNKRKNIQSKEKIKKEPKQDADIRANLEFHKHPFSSNELMYNFRASAAYYLCWHTLQSSVHLAQPANSHCISSANANVNATLLLLQQQHGSSPLSFDCAEYAFCPHTCCHTSFASSKLRRHFFYALNTTKLKSLCSQFVAQNPCQNLTNANDAFCRLSHTHNNNLADLKRGIINVTCDCKPGYEYSNELNACIDIDECLLATTTTNHGRSECSDESNTKTCVNLPGAYACLCRAGFQMVTSAESATNGTFKCVSIFSEQIVSFLRLL